MSSFEDIKILYKVQGSIEGSVYPLTEEEFNNTDSSLTLRERASVVANSNLPEGTEIKVMIKEEDRIGE